MRRGLLQGTVLATAIWGTAAAQMATPSDAVSDLTGSRSREWTLQAFHQSLGPGGHCTSGEAWTFATGGKLDIARCINGAKLEKKLSWSLRVDPTLTAVLTILKSDEHSGTYEMRFRSDGNKKFMLLTKVIGKKTIPSDELEFSLLSGG
jgi:hypothetical protein